MTPIAQSHSDPDRNAPPKCGILLSVEHQLCREQTLRMFVDHASDAFFLLDDDWVFLDVNRQACLSLGYTREELVGMNPADFNPDITPSVREDLDRRIDAGEVIALESRHRRKDGTVFPVEVRAQAFREGGRRFGVALARDVSDRKRAEEALRASEERFRGTFEHAAVGIAHIDAESRCLRATRKCARFSGTRAKSWSARPCPR